MGDAMSWRSPWYLVIGVAIGAAGTFAWGGEAKAAAWCGFGAYLAFSAIVLGNHLSQDE
jgi:hypothetical protein